MEASQISVWFPVVRGGGGTDVFTRRLASALRKHLLNVELTFFHPKYQFFPLALRSVKPPRGTDIIHTNTWNGFAFHRREVPSVTTHHHLDTSPRGSQTYRNFAVRTYHQMVLSRFVRISLRTSSAVTSVSRYSASTLPSDPDAPHPLVLHNWVDTERYRPVWRRDLHDGPFRLLFVGNLTKRKGADLLAPIMKRLGREFLLKYTSGLRGPLQRPPLENMVPVGRVSEDDLIRLLQECDALLLPSRLEGFGLAAREAMACGKPVIASNNTAIGELVEHGRTGLLCETGNVDSFVSACRLLAGDPSLCVSLGRRARAVAVERYSEDVVIPRYVALYRTLVQQGPQAS